MMRRILTKTLFMTNYRHIIHQKNTNTKNEKETLFHVIFKFFIKIETKHPVLGEV